VDEVGIKADRTEAQASHLPIQWTHGQDPKMLPAIRKTPKMAAIARATAGISLLVF